MMSIYKVNKYNYQTIMKANNLHKNSYKIIKMWVQTEEERSHCLNENKWWFDFRNVAVFGLDIYRG